MDAALLKERESFKRRAMAQPTVEKPKRHKEEEARPRPPNRRPVPKPRAPPDFDYKTNIGSSTNKFAILTKIVKFMKRRHQEGSTHGLSLDEIMDETNQLDVSIRHRHWLSTEALLNNPKILVENDTFKYKPKLKVHDRKSLRRHLDHNDQHGLGGTMLDDVEEALPDPAKALKVLGDQIVYVTRPDKKKVIFYNDKSSSFNVDEEIVKIWRSVAVEGVDERKIEEYLQKQGIASMQDIEVKKATMKRKRTGRKSKNANKHNNHLESILKDYSEDTKK